MSDVEIIQGDCREVMTAMPAGSVDLLVTDPPYLTGETDVSYAWGGVGKVNAKTYSVGMPWGYSLDWIDVAAKLSPRHWVVYCNYLMLGDVQIALARHAKLGCVFVWRKTNAPQMARPVPRFDCEFILWFRAPSASCERMREFKSMVLDVPMLQAGCMAGERVLKPGSGKALHPCQKPLAVVRPFLSRLANPGATVLDPFAGTGTTGKAALQAGMKFIGIESDPQLIPVIRRRVAEARTPLFDGAIP